MKLKSYQVEIDVETDEERIAFMDLIIAQWSKQYPMAKKIMYVIIDTTVIMSYEDWGDDDDNSDDIIGRHFAPEDDLDID